jgi:uncharacterized membrane protein HdeD (DUF308 family)
VSSSFGISPVSGSPGQVRSYGTPHLLVLGVIDLICGVIALVWPGVTVLALALIFGVMLLLAGLMALGVGSVIRRAGGSPTIGWVVGAVAVVAGLVCIFHPGAGVWAIIVGCALWFLITGVGDLVVASAAPRARLLLVVLGVLSIVAAVVLLVRPGLAIITVALIAGIAFLVRGVGELSLALMARRSGRST